MRAFMANHFHRRGDMVCHWHPDCTAGQQVPANERERGSGNLPSCEACQRLSANDAAVRKHAAFGRR